MLPLTSVYYVFSNNASAFLDFFGFFATWEFSTTGEKFTEQSGVYFCSLLCCNYRTHRFKICGIIEEISEVNYGKF